MTEQKLIRVGDILSLRLQSRGHTFSIASEGFYPCSANLRLFGQLEAIQTFFYVYRKGTRLEGQDIGARQPISYEDIILLKHYLSQKLLCVRASESGAMQLYLRESLSPQCQFKLLPLFRCQIINSRRVRQDEEILLASAFLEQGVENYLLTVHEPALLREIRGIREAANDLQLVNFNSDFFMSKATHTSLVVSCKGEIEDNSQLLTRKLYRVKNVQMGRWMNFSESAIAFNNSPSEFDSFLYLVLPDSCNSFNQVLQSQTVFIRSQKYQQYLQASADSVQLTSKLTKNCQFRLVQFRNASLSKLKCQFVYFLQHAPTGRNISAEFNQKSNQIQCRLSPAHNLKDTVQFVPVAEHAMNRMFFLSQVRVFLELYDRKDTESKQRIEQSELLEQLNKLVQDMIVWIFSTAKEELEGLLQKFFGLSEMPIPKQEDQNNFLNCRITHSILKIINRLTNDFKSSSVSSPENKKSNKPSTKDTEGKQRKDLQSKTIQYLFVLLSGLCLRNLPNATLLISNMHCIYDNLAANIGALECFIQIFRGNRQFLKLLQNQKVDNKPYIYVFISKLREIKRGNISLAINITQLLRSLVLVNTTQTLRLNQAIIGEQFPALQKALLLEFKVTGDSQLMVKPWKEQPIEVEDMYIRKGKYTQDLILVQHQLGLYGSLCYGRNYVNIQVFRKMIPLELIIRYLNKHIDGEFKSTLLYLFITMYLDVSPRKVHLRESIICLNRGQPNQYREEAELTNRLLNKTVEIQMMEGQGFESDSNLEDIKGLLLKETDRQITQARFSEAFHMYIEVLGKFISFGMLTPSEKNEFKKSLEKFLVLKEDFAGDYRQSIYAGVLAILVHFELDDEEERLRDFVNSIKNNSRLTNIERSLDTVVGREQSAIIQQEDELLGRLFDKAVLLDNYEFLDRLIVLLQRRKHPKANLLRGIRSVIILDDSQSISLYSNLKKNIIPQLDKRCENFNLTVIKLESNNIQEAVRKLSAIIEEINMCFFAGHDTVDMRHQHLILELGVHIAIINFLAENFKQLHTAQKERKNRDLDKAFLAAFRFMSLFITYGNSSSCKVIQRSFPELCRYLQLQDFGQKRLFLELSRIQQIKPIIENKLVNTILQNPDDSIYVVSILIEYTKKLSIPDRRFIDDLCKRFISEEKCLEDLLRVRRTASGYELPINDKSPPGQLIFYTQALKLVNILCQNVSEKKYFHSLCRKFLPLDLLLRALQLSTIFDERKNSAIFSTLLSRQLLQTISLLYLQDIRLPPQSLELLLAYIQKAQKMISCYGEHAQSEKAMLLAEFIQNPMMDCHEIMRLVEGLETGSDAKNTQFLSNFDWMTYLLTKVSPIIGQLLHLATNSESSDELIKKQAFLLRDSYETILQDMIYDMMTLQLFEKNQLEYLRGIDRCGEAFGMKFKLGFQVKPEESRPERIDDDDDTGEILIDRRLKRVVDSHQRSSSVEESAIYKSIFQMLHNEKLRTVVLEENSTEQARVRETLRFGDRKKKVLGIMARSYIDKLEKNTIEKRDQRKFFKEMVRLLCQLLAEDSTEVTEILSETRIIECSVRYLAKNTYPDMSVVKKIIDFSIGMLGIQQSNRYVQDKFLSAFEQVQNSSLMFRVLRVPIEQEKLAYSKVLFNQQLISKKSCSDVLVYELDTSKLEVETCLNFYAALVQGDNKTFKESLAKQAGLVQQLLDLLRVYIKFILGFTKSNRPYYPYMIDSNLCACLGAISEFTNYQANTNILADKNFSESINVLLSLSDSLKALEESQSRSQLNYTQSLISECPSQDGRKYLKAVYFLSVNSERFYKDLGGINNPFLPVVPNYLKVKTKVMKILLELINLEDNTMFEAIFKGVSQQTLRRNILEIYEKNIYLFSKDYDVFSFDINSQAEMYSLTPIGCELKQKVQASFRLQNGFSLLFILLRIQASQNRGSLQQQRLEAKKNKARKSIIQAFSFFKDLGRLIVRMCTCCFPSRVLVDNYIRSKSESEGIKMAINFFLLNSGHVEVIVNGCSHNVYFPLLPECARNINIQKNYLNAVDLSSPQTKGESLVSWTNKFVLLHENEEIYKRKYKSFPFIDLLLRHIELFKNISFIITVLLNIIILLNSNSEKDSGLDPQFSIYDKIMLVQMTISYLLLIFFSMKEMPLVMLETTRELERRKLEYGSNFASYPFIIQKLIWFTKIIFYPQFMYHFLYTIFVTVAYFERIFVAILLLDIFIRIPLLRRVLMSIWRPKVQILLTILAFILVEYYFSIMLYFVFNDNTFGMCTDLQSCFSFVFYVTYKVVGGFPGYIFQYKDNGQSSFKIGAFQIFQDIYVIVIFQIFFAVLSGIIIDNFSIIRAEQEQKMSNLRCYCLVCGGNSSTINESKSNFSRHIALEHNIWDYFSFITYMTKKPERERTQLEQHVLRCIDRKSIEWLPSVAMAKIA